MTAAGGEQLLEQRRQGFSAGGQFFSRSTALPPDPLANSTVQLLAAGLVLGVAGLTAG